MMTTQVSPLARHYSYLDWVASARTSSIRLSCSNRFSNRCNNRCLTSSNICNGLRPTQLRISGSHHIRPNQGLRRRCFRTSKNSSRLNLNSLSSSDLSSLSSLSSSDLRAPPCLVESTKPSHRLRPFRPRASGLRPSTSSDLRAPPYLVESSKPRASTSNSGNRQHLMVPRALAMMGWRTSFREMYLVREVKTIKNPRSFHGNHL